ncbi:alpha-ketoacid dehydrogenase subunit beta [Brevibacterium sp. 50QC2O2]|uniref:alpha-ketoacid dehydrogenase subunit beta n=1 Tax=Brevibacterium TaxID=1696 RepID=UPI00211C2B88|nr:MULTISPECIES: alpha-ketoacid dehydrogenase subunit beta [unclassified Brevibacterium]MCQ9367719.1 alpha-ketoacid dehydrogenase subunit beta [Brevibacterium sp. 91QC2O2]MCQ9384975.1 alpha-ketoacid dehydrogenase subunit beta [Brevibacterium sp. 68QC2CO]MCQ9387978.1 alpha-ketoacid dehydrogenase subunit beta [Brevibacterium sp. 50QC2O2]
MTTRSYIQAITDALDLKLADDEKTLIFGEDVGKNGGVFRATQGLQDKHGTDRVFDTPLAESGILGLAIGLGATGWRPIPEIQFMGFTFEAVDSLVGQMSRNRFRTAGALTQPITVRTPYGGGTHTAELHSDSLEHLFTGVPGLRVVAPATAYDAKGLLISAIESNDPVLFMEHLKLYRSIKEDVPDGIYRVPLDTANVVREGTDITLVAYGAQVHEALKAAEALAQDKVSAEVIDLRTISPIDTDTVFASVDKTGRLVVVQEAQKMAGVGAHVVSAVAENRILSLEAPIGRVSAPDSVYAFAADEHAWLPNADGIAAKAREILSY